MFAAIYIPDFCLQAALRHEPELFSRSVALLDEERKVVFQMTGAAHTAGVAVGMTPTQASARCSSILIRPRSPALEGSAADILLQCAYAFSPSIEATAPGVCTLDMHGLPVVTESVKAGFSELQPWGEKIISALARFNLRACVGIAGNPDLALHAAKMARPFLHVENEDAFASSLPVVSMNPPSEILGLLERWGIRTLGEFTALQKNNLAERLGAEALDLFDHASARSIRPLNLVKPREVFEETMELENEIETLDPLLFVLRRFVEQLSRRLELFYFVAEEIQLRLILSSSAKYEQVFRVPAPTRNVETLFRMLQTHLENVRTDSPIVALQLAVKPGRSEQFQFGLFETSLRDPNHFFETLAQLTSILGSDRVGSPVLENSHRPDAFRMERVDFESGKKFADRKLKLEVSTLPLHRFRPPLPVVVEMRGNRPVLLHSERFVGPIAKAHGPFRRSGHWWENEQFWSRDEWDIETREGELFRIFVQNDQWFLEGVFD